MPCKILVISRVGNVEIRINIIDIIVDTDIVIDNLDFHFLIHPTMGVLSALFNNVQCRQ